MAIRANAFTLENFILLFFIEWVFGCSIIGCNNTHSFLDTESDTGDLDKNQYSLYKRVFHPFEHGKTPYEYIKIFDDSFRKRHVTPGKSPIPG